MKPDQVLASLSSLVNQKRPVTRVAIIFFSLVCLSLGGMQAWSVYKAREVQLHDATIAGSNMARSLADQISSAIELSDTILGELAERVQREADVEGAAALATYAAERVRRVPMLGELSVFDASGAVTFTSRTGRGDLPDATSQVVFHRGEGGAALLIGAPLRDPRNGEWLLPLSRRRLNTDGSFGGVVVATMRLVWLREFCSDFELGAGGAILVALDSGPLLLSEREHDLAVGKDMRSMPGLKTWHQTGGAGPVIRDDGPGASGATLYSFRHLRAYPILVTVARRTDAILASWWESAYLSTAGVSLLMLIQLWLGARLYGQIALRDRLEDERRSLQKLLVKKSRSLRRQAHKDALTGIANRRMFDTRLVREFSRAADAGSPIALVILDVDFFKNYNDEYGHPAGDECLKFVAACVNSGRRRSQDLAARMGGEEFALLLPNTGLRGAIAVAEAIRKRVATHKLMHVTGRPHSITVSCGVHALVPFDGISVGELVEAADKALYLAKSSGRNRVRAEGTMPEARHKRFSLVVNK